jgi:hypothetical protein
VDGFLAAGAALAAEAEALAGAALGFALEGAALAAAEALGAALDAAGLVAGWFVLLQANNENIITSAKSRHRMSFAFFILTLLHFCPNCHRCLKISSSAVRNEF